MELHDVGRGSARDGSVELGGVAPFRGGRNRLGVNVNKGRSLLGCLLTEIIQETPEKGVEALLFFGKGKKGSCGFLGAPSSPLEEIPSHDRNGPCFLFTQCGQGVDPYALGSVVGEGGGEGLKEGTGLGSHIQGGAAVRDHPPLQALRDGVPRYGSGKRKAVEGSSKRVFTILDPVVLDSDGDAEGPKEVIEEAPFVVSCRRSRPSTGGTQEEDSARLHVGRKVCNGGSRHASSRISGGVSGKEDD
jgi:hypothetical protein